VTLTLIFACCSVRFNGAGMPLCRKRGNQGGRLGSLPMDLKGKLSGWHFFQMKLRQFVEMPPRLLSPSPSVVVFGVGSYAGRPPRE
jgi:hypothetical protein